MSEDRTKENANLTATELPLYTGISRIDDAIIKLVEQRAELLAKYSDQAGSLLDHCQISLRNIQSGRTGRSTVIAERLIPIVCGLSHQWSVRAARIAYLGPEFSYSFAAARKFFGAEGLQPVQSIGAVFDEIERQQADYGIVPIENSTDGRIVDTLTMFVRKSVRICGEVYLPIHHNLLAKCPRSEIREVHSKPQALSQCRAWLAEHLPGARWVEVASTAVAAQNAATLSGVAAVASIEAGVASGLHAVAENIEDNPNNVTRFCIIGNEEPAPTGRDKTSLMFQVPHKPGALADAMLIFRDCGLNLTWIESFPIPGSPNEYFFFVELDGHRSSLPVEQAIRGLGKIALRLSTLGSYPKGIL